MNALKISRLKQLALGLAIFSQFWSLSIFADVGGGGTGGGFVQHSTKADLEEVIANFPEMAWEISDQYLFGKMLTVTWHPLKLPLVKMTQSIMGRPQFAITPELKNYLAHLKFNIVEGPCYEGKEEHDASTEFKQNAPICLSAPRLSRFPKSVLKQAVLPLVFHEVAHQFDFKEPDAIGFQALADLYLQYRPIYLSALRAQASCGMTSDILNAQERQDLQNIEMTEPQMSSDVRRVLPGNARAEALMFCGVQSHSTGEALERIYNGNSWSVQASGLSAEEESRLLKYRRQDSYSFLTMAEALKETAIGGVNGCDYCKANNLDAGYLMMLAAKSARFHIDKEVGRLQDLIVN